VLKRIERKACIRKKAEADACEGQTYIVPEYVAESEHPWDRCTVCGLPILIDAEVVGEVE